ncbi:stress response protein NST1-like [Impatiens glandulifera]|uniref:stress response protein NST1-like n=1 Tax=Impatiens glandulifera TaxID=253017 RepID=UPI001FB0E756|nr:stress response protein NST1-like [Impatiens glandulifera]
MSDYELTGNVFGRQEHGRVIGMGTGVRPTQFRGDLRGRSKSQRDEQEVEKLRTKLQEDALKREQLEALILKSQRESREAKREAQEAQREAQEAQKEAQEAQRQMQIEIERQALESQRQTEEMKFEIERQALESQRRREEF